MLSYVLRHPQDKPQLLVRIGGGWVSELGEFEQKVDGRDAFPRVPDFCHL